MICTNLSKRTLKAVINATAKARGIDLSGTCTLRWGSNGVCTIDCNGVSVEAPLLFGAALRQTLVHEVQDAVFA